MPSGRYPARRVGLVQLGVGQVGAALASMVLGQRQEIERRQGIELTHVAIADSRGLVFDGEGLSDADVTGILQVKAEGRPIPAGSYNVEQVLAETMLDFEYGVLVDASADEGMGRLLEIALERGWGVVLANKLPLAGSLSQYHRLAKDGGRRLRYEATVGAGLPVVSTLRMLLDTGNEVQRIDGCFSGTLGFLSHRLELGHAFSASVREARALGYTEPDARQDLSGKDVARKALILARTWGQKLELADVDVEPLFPAEMAFLTSAEFMASLERLDDGYRKRVAVARDRGQVLRYVAEVSESRCRVGWRDVGQENLMAALRGPDNIARFRTNRYSDNPLVIVGPGAGPECTAAGVLSDILDLAGRIG